MSAAELHAVPLTTERFAPYGEVIAATSDQRREMNAARFERFVRLARVDVDDDALISIARAREPSRSPYRFDMLERHPLGSQAFIPLRPFRFVVVVALSPDDRDSVAAFVTDGRQGVNYRRGVWHMPLIALEAGQEFLIVDRAGADNCEERVLAEPMTLHWD